MTFLSERKNKIIKEKYKQLRLHHQYGGIYTIEYTQSLCVIKKNEKYD